MKTQNNTVKHQDTTTIKIIRQDLIELEVILLDLQALSNQYGICPHCLINNIIDTQDIPTQHQEDIINQVTLAQEKKSEIIRKFNKLDVTLAL